MIDEERWQRLDRLFEEAVSLSGAEREDFMARACADDAELRQELERLLAADGRSWSLVEGPPPEPEVAPAAQEPEPEVAPDRIGPYRVLGEIGRGGMGTVYAAVRDDDHYRQRVAIKLIRRGMDYEFILGRFRQERQILADLEHPGIARLLDGGATRDGRPYLVMEHVEGVPVDAYCDRHRLPVRRRLELFAAICDVVQFAHRSLVVHRDLKPRNILVTEDGIPKLLDFGTAKLLDSEGRGREGAQTSVGWRMMTPAFASPEQVRGDPITTATDVYSLGVLLHWLLVGQSPYHRVRRSRRSIEWAICEEAPRPPSAAFSKPSSRQREAAGSVSEASEWSSERAASARSSTPRQLGRRLRGDLDAVVARALSKDPERRYGTVGALADDVRRHLGARPVLARQGALSYRLGRFARRNPVAVAATAVAALALIAGSAATSWQARVAKAERSRAEQAALESQAAQQRAEGERATAQEVSGFLQALFERVDPIRSGGQPTARELLDRGSERIESLGDRPLVQAAVAQSIGVAYQSFGDYRSALQLLELSLANRKEALGEDHLDVAESVELLARLHHDRGDPRSAKPLFSRVLELRRSALGEDDPAVLRSLHDLGLNLYALGDYAGAEALHRDSVERSVALYGDDSALAANALNSLAGAVYAQGDIASSAPMFERVLEVRRQSLGESHPMVGAAMLNLSELRREVGELAEAERLTREGIEIWRASLPADHPMFSYGVESLAAIARKAGDHEEAERRLREALTMRRKTLPAAHPLLAQSLLALGEFLVERGRPREAEPLLREAAATVSAALPAGHWKLAEVDGALGACLAELGRPAQAETLLVESRHRILERLGEHHPEAKEATQRLVRFYEERGDRVAAARLVD